MLNPPRVGAEPPPKGWGIMRQLREASDGRHSTDSRPRMRDIWQRDEGRASRTAVTSGRSQSAVSCQLQQVLFPRHATPPLVIDVHCPIAISTLIRTLLDVIKRKIIAAKNWGACITFVNVWTDSHKTSSSAVAKRPRDASCLSAVSFNSTKCRAFYFIVSYVDDRFITACN